MTQVQLLDVSGASSTVVIHAHGNCRFLSCRPQADVTSRRDTTRWKSQRRTAVRLEPHFMTFHMFREATSRLRANIRPPPFQNSRYLTCSPPQYRPTGTQQTAVLPGSRSAPCRKHGRLPLLRLFTPVNSLASWRSISLPPGTGSPLTAGSDTTDQLRSFSTLRLDLKCPTPGSCLGSCRVVCCAVFIFRAMTFPRRRRSPYRIVVARRHSVSTAQPTQLRWSLARSATTSPPAGIMPVPAEICSCSVPATVNFGGRGGESWIYVCRHQPSRRADQCRHRIAASTSTRCRSGASNAVYEVQQFIPASRLASRAARQGYPPAHLSRITSSPHRR